MYRKSKILFLLGTTFAMLLCGAATAPYVSAWWSFLQTREMNVTTTSGENYMLNEKYLVQ
jgi:hypothetical protein